VEIEYVEVKVPAIMIHEVPAIMIHERPVEFGPYHIPVYKTQVPCFEQIKYVDRNFTYRQVKVEVLDTDKCAVHMIKTAWSSFNAAVIAIVLSIVGGLHFAVLALVNFCGKNRNTGWVAWIVAAFVSLRSAINDICFTCKLKSAYELVIYITTHYFPWFVFSCILLFFFVVYALYKIISACVKARQRAEALKLEQAVYPCLKWINISTQQSKQGKVAYHSHLRKDLPDAVKNDPVFKTFHAYMQEDEKEATWTNVLDQDVKEYLVPFLDTCCDLYESDLTTPQCKAEVMILYNKMLVRAPAHNNYTNIGTDSDREGYDALTKVKTRHRQIFDKAQAKIPEARWITWYPS